MAAKAKATEAVTEEITLIEGQEEGKQANEQNPADEIKAMIDAYKKENTP